MYKYRKIDNRYVVSIDNHTPIVKALTAFCEEMKVKSGTVTGIGAVDSMTLRFLDPATKKYVDKTFEEQMEIANLTGNVSTLDGKTYLHLHIITGRSDYSTLGGHLLEARLSGAGEFVVEDFGAEVEREFNPGIGLNCYKF